MSADPFRFLDLPAELRCMVYEHLDIETRRYVLKKSNAPECTEWKPVDRTDKSITLIRKSLPVAILATCRQVQAEANQFLEPKLRELEQEPVRFILGYSGTIALSESNGPFAGCFDDSKTDLTSNPRIRDISARCSAFLKHTRNFTAQDHVVFMITRRSRVTYEQEVLMAMQGACKLALDNNLAVKVTCRKRFPAVENSRHVMSGMMAEYLVRSLMVFSEYDSQTDRTFNLEAVARSRDWVKLLNGEG